MRTGGTSILETISESAIFDLRGPTDPKPEVETDACEVHHPGRWEIPWEIFQKHGEKHAEHAYL